jgi:hypothetical protein
LSTRVNVGGNESGQQSGFIGKGTTGLDTMWNLDGIVITDVNSGGASSSYYDFNAFEEVNISTGGNDLRQQTGGIGINFVTAPRHQQVQGQRVLRAQQPQHGVEQPARRAEDRRAPGAARWRLRGQGEPYRQHPQQGLRYRWPDRQGQAVVLGLLWQAEHRHRPLESDHRQDGAHQHQREDQLGRRPATISLRVPTSTAPRKSSGAKSATWPTSRRRSSGTRATSIPRKAFLHPLHGLYKVEDNHTFGSSLFVTGKYAWYGWGYGFDPIGGASNPGSVDLDASVAYGSYITAKYTKAWHLLDVSGSAFKTAGGASHEFKVRLRLQPPAERFAQPLQRHADLRRARRTG